MWLSNFIHIAGNQFFNKEHFIRKTSNMSLVAVVAIVLSMCGNLSFCKADEHQYDATNDQRQMDSNQPLGKFIISHSISA